MNKKLSAMSLYEKWLREEEPKAMSKEQKKEFLEAVSQYQQIGENIYRAARLRETAEQMGHIVDIAEQLTQDHKPNTPSEKKRIENLGGKIEFDGADWRVKDLSLSRAFGDLECTPYVTHLPQIYRYKISSSDKFIILGCDGLWDVLSNQDVVDYITELQLNKKFNGNYAKELAEHALQKGSLDNVSVIILFL